ncbi:hypothetical protein GQ457_01G032180 [Hibiscus cannabinus]
MGNEMGNNNTTGLREEDSTVEGKPVQGFDHADDPKGPNRLVPATEDKEEVDMKTEGETSPEDAGRTDYEKEQNHEVVASEDIHVNGKDEKEEVKGPDHLFPAAEDKKTLGNKMEPAYLEQDVLASSHIEDQENDGKEQDTSTILEVEGIPLKEAASNETNAGASLVLACGDESTHGMEYPCVDQQKHDEKEKDITINDEAEEQSSQEAEEAKGQDHVVPTAEDKSTWRNETDSASLEHDGLASPRIEDPELDEKEQDTGTILKAEEMSSKEAVSTDETNEEAPLVPAGGDESTCGTKTGLVLGDGDGMVHPGLEKPKPDDKEEDIKISDETVEQSSQEAASTDVIDRQGQLLVVVEGKATYANETCLVSSDPEGAEDLHGDNPKDHEKEEDINLILVDKEDSMQENGYAEEAKGQDHLFPADEDKNVWGNETESASLELDGLASPCIEDPAHDEKEQDASTILEVEELPRKEGASTDETIAEGCRAPASGDENCHGTETWLVFGDHGGMEYPSVEEQKHDEKEEDITINNGAQEQFSHEVASTDVLDRQGQLLAVVEDKANRGHETDLVSCDPIGTADLQSDNPKEQEKEVNNTTEPQEKPMAKDDMEGKNITIPAVDGADCDNIKAELASGDHVIVGDTPDNQTLEVQVFTEQGKTELDPPAESTEANAKPSEVVESNEIQPVFSSKNLEDHVMQKESNFGECLSGITHHVEDQNLMKEAEDKMASNSLSDQASSTSDDSVPREPVVVLEPESAEIGAKQMVSECNVPLKSKDMIISSLTCRDQENGFVSDSSLSTDTVESVLSDQSPEIGKERDEPGNGLGTITTVITNLPMKSRAKCNGELTTEMNSTKNGSPEPQVEVILLDETQNNQVEVSESEDKGTVLSRKDALIEEESDNGNCQIQSGEDGEASEEGSKADDQTEFSPQFMMNSHPVDASINSQKEQEKDSQQEVQLITDSADTFPMDQMYRAEETEEKKIIEEIVGKSKDSNPIENGAPRRENGEQCICHSYGPIEQTEAENSNESMIGANTDLTGKIVVPIVENGGEKPLTLSETKAVANGDHGNQRESVGRLSMESNPDSTTMPKSPSFDLDLRIDARAEESDQTPLLYQDKTTIDSFSSQPDVTDHEKPVADTENGETPSLYDSMAAQENGVTLERSDSEKSKTPFLGFLKEDEEADNNNMIMKPMKQDDQSTTKETTASKDSVSVKAVTSGTTKGKVKRKPRASLFGTCMCCATVMN